VALIKLEGMCWYQGKDLVKDYIDQFTELVDITEYSDNKTIVIKFFRIPCSVLLLQPNWSLCLELPPAV